MLEAIMSILSVIAWLGVVLGILLITNTLCGTVSNVLFNGEKFSFKRLFTGIGKALVFYISSALTCVAFPTPKAATTPKQPYRTARKRSLLGSPFSIIYIGPPIYPFTESSLL